MAIHSKRTSKLDLRLSPEAKQTLIAAAQATRCSVSQFVLASAAETLAERQRFELNAEQWEHFMAALDAPPQIVPQIQRLFREPSPLVLVVEKS
jgi:uncharacterized protein (DUF1778 family)